ncbi:TetR/AcrR family transcriptional regulator [Levilactobacillus cerevisiae]|uniref:TetR/AcrR family transcriptional regulator n=1 Tax=Levilactobacillus cerevisiae TaxID=1704076 RepID=UPI000F781A25|nr:TetR/AcrR family transcriptional regulator [Levilactobacillus cerevisiae]
MINQKDLTIKLNHIILIEGFQKLSMSKLATAVGISRASLYLYFKNKDEIVQAVVDRHLKFIAEHPVPKQFSPTTFLPIWLDSLLLMGSTTDLFMADLRKGYPELFQTLSAAYQGYFAQLAVYVGQGQASHFFLDLYSVDFVLFQAQTLVQGVLRQVQGRQLSLDHAGKYLEDTLHFQLAGLLPRRSQEQLDEQQIAGFEATVLREFRETYALIG